MSKSKRPTFPYTIINIEHLIGPREKPTALQRHITELQDHPEPDLLINPPVSDFDTFLSGLHPKETRILPPQLQC